MKQTIQSECMRRGIHHVFHFTKIENISAILLYGLMPRDNLEAMEAPVEYNDQYRFDEQKSASCLSIGHPNYKMFYSLRSQNPLQKWVVLAIDSGILWGKRCAFCKENAASSSVTAIPVCDRVGIDAFLGLFEPVAGMPTRDSLKLIDRHPTNPQAEVLVYDIIEPIHIKGIATQDNFTAESLRIQYPFMEFQHVSWPFCARGDYKSWR